jgi:hypothetical protein
VTQLATGSPSAATVEQLRARIRASIKRRA